MAECLLGITPDAAAKHAAHDVVKPTTASLFGRRREGAGEGAPDHVNDLHGLESPYPPPRGQKGQIFEISLTHTSSPLCAPLQTLLIAHLLGSCCCCNCCAIPAYLGVGLPHPPACLRYRRSPIPPSPTSHIEGELQTRGGPCVRGDFNAWLSGQIDPTDTLGFQSMDTRHRAGGDMRRYYSHAWV
ncbi:uncharacterized protein [Physcomitrium patens]|uniref:uncharacterized protein n=1 Tax=Physcomitrium patens TaxID=3218 RepID=UPI003CCD8CA6